MYIVLLLTHRYTFYTPVHLWSSVSPSSGVIDTTIERIQNMSEMVVSLHRDSLWPFPSWALLCRRLFLLSWQLFLSFCFCSWSPLNSWLFLPWTLQSLTFRVSSISLSHLLHFPCLLFLTPLCLVTCFLKPSLLPQPSDSLFDSNFLYLRCSFIHFILAPSSHLPYWWSLLYLLHLCRFSKPLTLIASKWKGDIDPYIIILPTKIFSGGFILSSTIKIYRLPYIALFHFICRCFALFTFILVIFSFTLSTDTVTRIPAMTPPTGFPH